MPAEGATVESGARSGIRQGPFLAGLALVTGATLALEVVDTRLLSVLTWYSLAFFVIAMGLCGLTAGAVRVYLRREDFEGERLGASLSRAALGFAVLAPLSRVLLLAIPIRTEPVATTVVLFLFLSSALALPFYPAGVVMAAALTRSPFPVGRVYAVDLVGGALGAALSPLVIGWTDASTSVLVVAGAGALGSIAFARASSVGRSERHGAIAAATLGLAALANATSDHGLRPLWVKERPQVYADIEQELWNSHSRIEVFRPRREPAMFWGIGSRCQAPVVTERFLVIDGHAATPLYHAPNGLESLRFIECDLTDVSNILRPGGASAIKGVRGSPDVQAALLAGHSPVVGVELNDRLLSILQGPMGEPTLVPHDPSVRLVHADARSYFARSTEHFRVVQASLTDTWAATGAGAHALGENGLYTVEAWRTFIEHLEPGGVFSVSRWLSVETSRMIGLAQAALLGLGVEDPRAHLALMTGGPVTTLIVGRDPLTADDEAALLRIADEKGFDATLLPSKRTSAERLERVLSSKTRTELDAASYQDALDLRPATDDRPFFFNVLRLNSLWRPLPDVTRGTIEGNLLATRTLGLTVLASLVLALATIAVPLFRRRSSPLRVTRSLVAALAYFSLIGVGFMIVEIALLQRLSLVLGEPIYGLVVVLATLVFAAGLGSRGRDRLPLERAPFDLLLPLAMGAVVAAAALLWPAVESRLFLASTPARLCGASGVTAIVAFPLGFAFPSGIRIAHAAHAEETPWLWGLNGISSVMASSLSVLIALSWGLTTLMLVGAACYVLLVPAVWVMRPSRAGAG
jgi:hypothetical protein